MVASVCEGFQVWTPGLKDPVKGDLGFRVLLGPYSGNLAGILPGIRAQE